ncbi:MAG TPA: dihydrofolate reductase family protein [Gaiellaceae bacterium]|nr:dihydrofolate reductase family protein [Gaiellaceae bacterium]
MSTLKFSITMSLDGFVAGPNQSRENPLGEGGMRLHEWAFATRTFREMQGREGGSAGLDDDEAGRWNETVGAVIMGRNMFGPVRGEWPAEPWNGWWGDDPPYHCPVFVLTHHAREPVEMHGGTTFHFVTDGIEAALERATEASNGLDVAIGGGASTAQQYLRVGLVDEMRIHAVPVLLGRGERLFDGLDDALDGFECVDLVSSPAAAHFSYVRRPQTHG